MFIAAIVDKISPTVINPSFDGEIEFIIVMYLIMQWILIGEEGVRLSLFYILNKRFKYEYEKRFKYEISWLLVSIIFGLIHLKTYDYNLLQCIFVIGLPSIIYGYLWKKTERSSMIWLAHLLYNSIGLGLILFA